MAAPSTQSTPHFSTKAGDWQSCPLWRTGGDFTCAGRRSSGCYIEIGDGRWRLRCPVTGATLPYRPPLRAGDTSVKRGATKHSNYARRLEQHRRYMEAKNARGNASVHRVADEFIW